MRAVAIISLVVTLALSGCGGEPGGEFEIQKHRKDIIDTQIERTKAKKQRRAEKAKETIEAQSGAGEQGEAAGDQPEGAQESADE